MSSVALEPYMVPSTPKFKYIDDVELNGDPINPFEMDEECLYEEIVECGVPLLEVAECLSRGRGHGSPLPMVARMTTIAGCDKPTASISTEIGQPVPLNYDYCLAGASGLGKGLTMSAQLVTASPLGGYRKITPASGEALIASFFETVPSADGKGTDTVRHTDPVIAEWAEIDQLAAKSEGKSSTLDAIMRSLWSGEAVGDISISRMKAGFGCRLEELSYRFHLVVGAQLAHAGRLLEDATGGTLQRIIWMPLIDAHAPSRREARVYRDRLAVLCGRPAGDFESRSPTIAVWGPDGDIALTEEIHDILWNDRQAVLSGGETINPLDTHLNNNRLRLAAVFAGWCAGPGGSVTIDRNAWYWAGCMLAISKQTRETCSAAWDAEKHQVTVAGGRTAADFQVAKEQKLADKRRAKLDRLKVGIVNDAAKIPGQARWKGVNRPDPSANAQRGELFRARTGTDRPLFTEALEELLAEEALVKDPSNRAMHYALGSAADQYLDAEDVA